MAHGGIKGFSTQKLTWGSAVGIPFNVGVWIGPDGSSVLATLNPGGYGNAVTEDLSKSPMWLKRITADGDASGIYADYRYFGIGDQGGAPQASSVAMVERSIAGGSPIRVIEGESDQIFKDLTPALAAHLPTYKGELELVNHSAGSITSEAYMKHWNRKNEQLANAAETAATAASWLGVFPYPNDGFYRAWDLVLGSQMHDIMPGTSEPKAYEFSWNDEVLALNQFASITENATAGVVSMLDTRAQGVPVAIYNPLAIEREDPVEATIPISGPAPESITAYNPEGAPVPTQILSTDGTSAHVLFIAKVPSTGYAIYDLRPISDAAPSSLKVTSDSLENSRYRVTLNAAGDIGSIFDKSLNRELLSAPARLSIHTENPANYPAWNMDWEDREKPVRDFVSGPATIRIVENGPARVALEVRRTTENSTFTQHIRLAAGGAADRLEIFDHIDWRAFEASLRSDFPLSAGNPVASFDDKVGVVRRGNDNPKAFELSQQQWMDLTDTNGAYGISILNDSKYGSDKPDDHTLRSTLIYTPGTRGGTNDQGTQDQGRHDILLGLFSHQGDWAAGRTPWQAARLNQPLRAFLTPQHSGPLGKTFSLLSSNNDQVQVVAIKKAEDSDEIIVRVKELTGKPASGISLRLSAPVTAAREVDAQERPIGNASAENGVLAFDMKGFGLRAFAIRLAPPSAPAMAVTSQPVPLAFDTDVISSRAKRTDGAMDAAGDAYPAEMFPATLERGGVGFKLGPVADGQKNAISANGQQIALPAGDFNRIHLLAAADGDAAGTIEIGDMSQPMQVPNWTGFIGQWDDRIWDTPATGYHPVSIVTGLAPGYIKRTPVAWFATHHNSPEGDAYYQFSYLFQLSYDLPAGTKSITLPDDPKIRVFAVSLSHEGPATPPAAPLYDTLADHRPGGAPIITQAGQSFTEATKIMLLPPLYHQPDSLHYTLDGSDPTAASPIYKGPFYASDTVHIAAREIEPNGYASPAAQGVVTIHDITPPRLVSILTTAPDKLDLEFSAPLKVSSAADAANYTIRPKLALKKVTPSADGLGVILAFASPLTAGVNYTVTLHGLADASPAENMVASIAAPFNAQNIVYTLPSADLPAGAVKTSVFGLPVLKTDRWTMNLLVKANTEPGHRVLLAGFGQTDGDPGANHGHDARYLAVFPDGITVWYAGSGHNVASKSPLDLGRWQMLTVTYNGDTINLYKDGEKIGSMRVALKNDSENLVNVGPSDPWDHRNVFEGSIHDFTIRRGALNDKEVQNLYEKNKPAP